MTFPIITYGGIDALQQVFQGIAALMGGKDFASLIKLSIVLASTWVAFESVFKRNLLLNAKWIVTYFIAFYILFLPKVTVQLIDRVQPTRVVSVANVPIGIAAFARFTSQIGDSLTRIMEMNFTLPNDLRYSKSGMIMASSLMNASTQFQITDPTFANNMQGFVGQCVFYDLLLHRYSVKDLVETNNVWSLVSQNASPARAFIYNGEITTCRKGAIKLTKDWKKAINDAQGRYAHLLFPYEKNSQAANAQLIKMLPLSYQYLTNLSASASQILQQNMMSNAIDQGILTQSAQTNATAALESYAFTKAQEQKRNSYFVMGEMAAYWLPLMKNVFEAILYGSFPFILLLSFFPFGMGIVKNYAFSMLWIQLWAPLYAIMNLIITVYASRKCQGIFDASQNMGALSMTAQSGLVRINSDMGAIAGYLSMSIPFLAMGLIKGMASVFTSLAQYIGGVTQSAAMAGASDITTGNMSMGNMQLDTQSAYNTNANHFDTSGRMMDGNFSYSTPGGSVASFLPDGTTALNTSGTISNLPIDIRLAESMRTAATHQSDVAQSNAIQQTHAAAESATAGLRSLDDWSESNSTSISNSDGSSVSHTSGVSNAVNQVHNMVERFAADQHISTAKAEQALGAYYADQSISGGMRSSGSVIGKMVEGFTGGHAEAQVAMGHRSNFQTTDTTENRQLFQSAQQFAQDNNFSQHVDDAVRATQEQSFRSSTDSNARLSENVNSSFDQAHTYREEASSSYSQSQSYREMASQTQENSASINTNANQQFVEWLEKQPAAGGVGGTIGLSGAEDILRSKGSGNEHLANQYAEQYVQEQTAARMQQWESSHMETPQQIQSGFASHNQSIGSTADIQTQHQSERTAVTRHGDDLPVIDSSAQLKAEAMIGKNNRTIETRRSNTRQEGEALQSTINTEYKYPLQFAG